MTEVQKTQLKALAKRVRDDFVWYAAQFLKIKTKDARIVSLRLKSVQRKIDAAWQKAKREGKPLRLYILKARREGASTHTDGRIFHRTATRHNRNAFIVAHEDKTSVELFDMVRLFLDELPGPLRPMERYSSRRELVFENPDAHERPVHPGLRSRLSVGTARNVNVGKGTNVHDLHLTEFAFYPQPQAFLDSIVPTVPDIVESAIVLETTPDNAGSYAHKLWQDAKEGKNQWTPLFLAWYDDDEYQIPFVDDSVRRAFAKSVTEDEAMAQKAYGLTLEQLHWRRTEMRKYSTPAAFFNQYPENDVDCWLYSGRLVFPADAIKRQFENVREPRWRGDLVEDEDGSIRLVESVDGPLKIWSIPKDHVPVIGADVAEGLESGDFSTASVIDPITLDQCAEWHGHVDPDLFGDVLYRLGWYFGESPIGVEANNHGYTTLTTLKKRYGKLYYRQLPKPTDPSTDAEARLGWKTDLRSKPLMEDFLRQLLRENAVTIRSKATLDELLSYVVHPNGSTGANTACYDDRVIALMIALQVAQTHRLDPATVERRRRKKRAILGQISHQPVV